MSARPLRLAALALAVLLGGCSGGRGGPTEPDPTPPGQGPLPPVPAPPAPEPQPGVQGTYVLERINESEPGQLVTIANPDGLIIGLYRFEATTLTLDPLGTFALGLRFTDDKTPFAIDDAGEYKQAGVPVEGGLALTFRSDVWGDSFTGVVQQEFMAIEYDFDGDGRHDTRFGFRRAD